jgi:hypothetical protein
MHTSDKTRSNLRGATREAASPIGSRRSRGGARLCAVVERLEAGYYERRIGREDQAVPRRRECSAIARSRVSLAFLAVFMNSLCVIFSAASSISFPKLSSSSSSGDFCLRAGTVATSGPFPGGGLLLTTQVCPSRQEASGHFTFTSVIPWITRGRVGLRVKSCLSSVSATVSYRQRFRWGQKAVQESNFLPRQM